MTSPNEPGYPRAADGPGSANGSIPDGDSDTSALGNAIGRGGEVPPWQRGPAGRAQKQPRSTREPARPEPLAAAARPATRPVWTRASTGSSPAARRLRLRRRPRKRPNRCLRAANRRATTPSLNEAYASELPDLSGGTSRPPQRKAVPERAEPPVRPASPGRVQVAGRPHNGPVRASMQIRRIDPWSALKVSLVLSVALFFVWMIAVAFLYLVLGGMGVWAKLNSNVGDLLTSASGQAGGELVSSGTIFGGAALIGLVNIVLLTAMATVGVFIYNLTTDLVGGVEVTLADRD